MTDHLKRLARALAAYQVADIVSKLLAVGLLPLYTRFIHPQGYGDVELIASGVIFVSIVLRFGMIEAFVRFYFSDQDQVRRDALVRRSAAFLLVTTTLVAIPALAAAAPLSHLVLGRADAALMRVAVLGLWTFTNLELAYGLLRVEERVRAYATASLINVLGTIAASVVLVVVLGQGPTGLLLGNYGTSTLVLVGLWWTARERLRPRRVLSRDGFRTLLGFGLPTVPAEASVYALSVVDRFYLLHVRSAAFVGLYSIAIKLAGGIAFVVRAFQYAWPPLAYSLTDDLEAARLYGLVTTLYVLLSGFLIAGLTLFSRTIVSILAQAQFHDAYRALPWVSLGWALYGLFVIFIAIAGRAKVTTRNFPAALAGLIVNVVLLILLVGPLGLAGAGIALCGAYVIMMAVMHLLTRGLFHVDFEWRRLAQTVLITGGVAAVGDVLLPAHGAAGLLSRAAALVAIPVLHLLTRFATVEELSQLRRLTPSRRSA